MKKEKTTETASENKATKKETKPAEKPAAAVETAKTQTVTKVGSLLKNMRMEKGLKIADIAKTLCIRKQYLEAIEDNNYQEIPDFPYGVGFIRSYADFLGLNSGNIVELFKEETNTQKSDVISVAAPQSTSGMPSVVYVVLSLAALGLIYGAWRWMGNDNSPTIEEDTAIEIRSNADNDNDIIIVEELVNAEGTEAAGGEEAAATEAEETSVPAENEAAKEAVTNEANKETAMAQTPAKSTERPAQKNDINGIPQSGIFIEVVDETWVEVKNDLKLYLSKVLKAGDSYTLPNDTGLKLSVGKSNGVNVYVNGEKTDLTHNGKKMNIDIDAYLASRP
ncbi:MAG: helix-turn-helix domain-containing protein [Alphaproteobacteria bacterium]|nr:helix-turn-helix domain-containing protein [Alphaproteobacteria bacterium]